MFEDCSNLEKIAIPDGITTIPYCAFFLCDKLHDINIPDSVTVIGDGAFSSCENLAENVIPKNVSTIGKYAFEGTDLTYVSISDGVTEINASSFSGCTKLYEVELPDTLTSIGASAFDGCESLVNINIPNGVSTIGQDAFSDCDSLLTLTIPDSVTSISNGAFGNCSSLTDVYYGGTEKQWNEISIGSYNEDLTSATIHYNSTANVASAVTVQEANTVLRANTAMLTAGNSPADNLIPTDPAPGDTATPDAVCPGEDDTEVTDTYALKAASFQGLVPGQQYVLLAVASLDAENPLAADNLLYIDQAEALEGGTLVFRYVQREATDISYVVACGASNKDLADAAISFPEMKATGSIQAVDPTVVYDGKTLTEGQDYIIVGTVSFTDPGEYTCHIRGVRNYTGLAECAYTVLENPLGIAVGVSRDTKWVLSKDGILTVYGAGAMGNYTAVSELPWYTYIEQISSVVIEEGVTGIGSYAFYSISNVVSVTISDTVTSIGEYAFGSCTALAEITFTGDAPVLGENSFLNVAATVTYPGNNITWTEEATQQYGGTITWVSSVPADGWVQEDGTWYYLTSSGKMATGWTHDGSYWYYLDATGAMVTGTHTIDGKTYIFNSHGVWIG